MKGRRHDRLNSPADGVELVATRVASSIAAAGRSTRSRTVQRDGSVLWGGGVVRMPPVLRDVAPRGRTHPRSMRDSVPFMDYARPTSSHLISVVKTTLEQISGYCGEKRRPHGTPSAAHRHSSRSLPAAPVLGLGSYRSFGSGLIAVP